MGIFAIVPVKRISGSKRRLSERLTLQQRKSLTLAMLQDVLQALKASAVEKIVIVSKDSSIKTVADNFGAAFLVPSNKGLNSAIKEASTWCIKNHATSMLTLHADVPLVTPKDIDTIIQIGLTREPQAVLVPSRDGGTNALFQNPPNIVSACFGPNSFQKYLKEARVKRTCIKLYYSVGTGLDIDYIEDLLVLVRIQKETLSKEVVCKMGIIKNRKK
jgi:2-phospho-L-lactate guanylyltransferase